MACIQAPAQKWFKKVRKAQVNVMTYDESGQLLRSTNGFVISENGMALSDYTAFKGAARAIAIDEAGKQYEIDYIAGANSLYDVVRFHINGIKTTPIMIAPTAALKGGTAYVMPYLSNKSGTTIPAPIADVSRFNEQYSYYTLTVQVPEKSTSCPVMNEDGEVIGLLQMAAKDTEKQCFAISADYPLSLVTTAFSATTADYNDIGIRKELPADASQANSFIYLTGTRDTTRYMTYVDDFIKRFPAEANGYVMKSEILCAQGRYAEAEQNWIQGLEAAIGKDEIHYDMARGIFSQAQKDPNIPDTWTLERALTEAQAAYEANPLPTYTALEGHILYSQHAYEEAFGKFTEVCRTNLRSAEHFLYAAQCRQMLNDTIGVLAMQDSAVACFTKPYVSEAATPLLMRANTLIAMGSYRDAVADLNEYEHLRINQVNANFYDQRAQAELNCRMFQQALDDYERACKLDPEEPFYRAQLAALHYRVGQTDEAIAAARLAISMDDEFADAYRILGVALRSKGQEAEARQQLQKAAQLGDTIAKSLLDE